MFMIFHVYSNYPFIWQTIVDKYLEHRVFRVTSENAILVIDILYFNG